MSVLVAIVLVTLVPSSAAPLDLQDNRLSAGYRARLLDAGQLLVGFCHSTNVDPRDVLSRAEVANPTLVAFVQFLHDTRKPLWLATHAVLCVQIANRMMKGSLRPAWDSIASWRLTVPVKSRVPMDVNIMKALFYFALTQAFWYEPSRKRIWLGFAICLRAGFFALLRPKEWFSLQRKFVKTPFGSGTLLSGARVAVITVLDAKNRAFLGRLQVRIIRDPGTISWLSWYASSMPPCDFLWPFSQQTCCACLKTALQFFDLCHLNLSPASLRAGGATWMLEQGIPVQTIKFSGCWASDKALACYLQEAESASTLLSLSHKQQHRLEIAIGELSFLECPPAQSFCST